MNNKQLSVLLMAVLMSSQAVANESTDTERRFYVGAGAGISYLEPDTSGTFFTRADDQDSGQRLFFGYDLKNYLSIDLEFADLGTSRMLPTGYIDYSVTSASALYYFYDQSKGDRQGLSAYVKGGLASIQNSGNVPFERVNAIQLAFGGGLEYGWKNGFAARLELETYDEDASLLTIGVMYRFGIEQKPVKTEIIEPVKPEPVIKEEPKDTDQDGVIDEQDQCPNTAKGTTVDDKGCEPDSDADGVIDANDQCPNTIAGAEVNKAGCAIFETSLEGVNFETGSTNLTKGAKAVLDKVVEALKQFKSLRVEVQAHTDSVGKKENNQRLSDARAKSVVNYLVSKGITPERLVGKGYGETQPLVSNKSAKGRAQNRRVEFHVLTAETKTEKQD